MNNKKNVCAYARVSTLKDVATYSLDNQVGIYTDYILNNENWNFCGVFVDEGKSGTTLKSRIAFNQMIEAARNGYIDLIITKSISRFSRNTVDALSLINELRLINVEIYFENEKISSFDPQVDFVISVISAFAEEEARQVSENVKWSNKKRFEKGVFHVVTKRMLGYDNDENGDLIINEQEAFIVRKIYSLYLEGNGLTKIVKWLNDNNYKTISGKDRWHISTISGILQNEKYTGNALLQKTFRPSFKDRNYKTNNGELPMYYVKDSHPEIISCETFKKVQELRKLKLIKYHKIHLKDENNHYSKPSIYAGFIRCSKCNYNYYIQYNNVGSSYSRVHFRCGSKNKYKKCSSDNISKPIFDEVLLSLINMIITNKRKFYRLLKEDLSSNQLYLKTKKEHLLKQQEIKRLSKELVNFDNELDDFEKALKTELKAKLRQVKIDSANIYKELVTTLNVDAFVKQKRVILQTFNEPIKSIDEFPFRDFFSHCEVTNKEEIIFYLGFPIDDRKKEPHFEGEVPFVIRKTNHTLNFNLFS